MFDSPATRTTMSALVLVHHSIVFPTDDIDHDRIQVSVTEGAWRAKTWHSCNPNPSAVLLTRCRSFIPLGRLTSDSIPADIATTSAANVATAIAADMATNSSGNVPQLHQLPPIEHNLDDVQDEIEHEFNARKDRRQACLQALHPSHNGRKCGEIRASVGPGRACRRCDRRFGEDGVVDHQEWRQGGVPGKAESECHGSAVG